MKSETRTNPRLMAAMLLGLVVQTACATDGGQTPPSPSPANVNFKTLDTNKNNNLSIEEFTAKGGLDDLAFRAADVNSDGQVDPDEYDKYKQLKKNDPLTSGSGNTEPAKPGGSPSKTPPSPSRY
jgi:hypothetical protein